MGARIPRHRTRSRTSGRTNTTPRPLNRQQNITNEVPVAAPDRTRDSSIRCSRAAQFSPAAAVAAVCAPHNDDSLPSGFNPNAVKLGGADGWGGWSVGLGPVGVAGPFDVPFGVFAFDDSRTGPVTADRVEPAKKLDDRPFPSVVVVTARRGKNRALVTASGE
jgi:hypothetical protein